MKNILWVIIDKGNAVKINFKVNWFVAWLVKKLLKHKNIEILKAERLRGGKFNTVIVDEVGDINE